jgi:hypothetical protein
MSSNFIFQKQISPKEHILESLLITLSLTCPLDSRHVKSIIHGFVSNERFYVSNQKSRGWLQKRDYLLTLTTQARERINSTRLNILSNRVRGDTKLRHEILLARTLFTCLMHLDFKDIRQIKKQKQIRYSDYIPDLTFITNMGTFFVEADTGTERVQRLEAKIQGFQEQNITDTLIFFTASDTNYNYFKQQNRVQFIHLHSPTLSWDVQKLTISSTANTAPQSFVWNNSAYTNTNWSGDYSNQILPTAYNITQNNPAPTELKVLEGDYYSDYFSASTDNEYLPSTVVDTYEQRRQDFKEWFENGFFQDEDED